MYNEIHLEWSRMKFFLVPPVCFAEHTVVKNRWCCGFGDRYIRQWIYEPRWSKFYSKCFSYRANAVCAEAVFFERYHLLARSESGSGDHHLWVVYPKRKSRPIKLYSRMGIFRINAYSELCGLASECYKFLLFAYFPKTSNQRAALSVCCKLFFRCICRTLSECPNVENVYQDEGHTAEAGDIATRHCNKISRGLPMRKISVNDYYFCAHPVRRRIKEIPLGWIFQGESSW